MADITKPNLPDAGAVDYNSGDIDYLIATDAVYYVNANRPHRNLAHRDNLLESKLDTVIDWLNASRGSVADLDTRLDVSINEDGTLKTAPDITEIEQAAAAALDSRAQMLRALCPSGWLPPHRRSQFGNGQGIGYVLETSASSGDARYGEPTGSLIVRPHSSVAVADSNIIRLMNAPHKVNVNGYVIQLEQEPSSKFPTTITLPAAPSTGARQDLVILEVWKEEVEPGASDDVFFPFGNVHYDESGTFDGCTLANTNQTGGNYPAYLATSAEHGYYVAADDANIADFIADERNNVGMTNDGKFFQVRWRIATLENLNVDANTVGSISGSRGGSGYWPVQAGSILPFQPQGQKATRPAPAAATTGALLTQTGGSTAGSTILDTGILLGGAWTAWTSPLAAVSGLSLDGFTYNIPIAIVHRRNSTAWDKAGNMNGAGSISSGTSGRPDDLYYDEVNERDIVDLRHRVSPDGWGTYKELYEETLQQLLKSDLKTNWESYQEDPDGNGTFADLDIYGTLLLRAEGVKATSFDSSWDVVLRLTCNNGINAKPDGMRNYYSDQPGEQALFGRIANVGADGAIPTAPFTYVTASKTLTFDATDLQANDGSHASRPQWSGRMPDLYWMDAGNYVGNNGKGTKVFATFSGLTGDSISAVIEQETYVFLDWSGAPAVTNGDVYQAPSGTQVTLDGLDVSGTAGSGYFTGATLPDTGVYNKISGGGPASFTVTSLIIGSGYPYWGAPATEYLGEGYDLHSGKGIAITAYLGWKAGSGFLSRVPYDDHSSAYDGLNSIKRTEFRINGTQVLPDNGDDFHPFGSALDPDVDTAGIPDSHTKTTCLEGFVRRGNVVSESDEGTYDTSYITQPCVIKDGSTYKMWYVGSNGTGRILYATSTDGVTWSNHQLVVNAGAEGTYDTGGCFAPCVIKDGSTYKMWYAGSASSVSRIIYCTSSDGITWSGHTMVLDIGDEGTYDTAQADMPWVIKDGSTYRMLYGGIASTTWRIIYADSADGTTWANHQMVVAPGGNGTYDTSQAHTPRFIKDNAIYKLWFYGDRGSSSSTFYVTSTDCKYWSRPSLLMHDGADTVVERTGPILNTPCVIKDNAAYKFWAGHVNSGVYGMVHGVFSMQDTSNSGSSLTGVYGTTGTDNFAPTADDDVLVYYEARALQQDFSRLGGSHPSKTLTYLLKYLPDFAIMTTLGTGGKPASSAHYPQNYRDAFGTIYPRYYQLNSDDFTINMYDDNLREEVPSSGYDERRLFKNKVPYAFGGGYYGDSPQQPRAGDYISAASLYVQSYADYDYNVQDTQYTFFGEYNLTIVPLPDKWVYYLMMGIGEKNNELFGSVCADLSDPQYGYARSPSYFPINLIGRPLSGD